MENCETRAKPPAPLSRSTVYETGGASIQQRRLEEKQEREIDHGLSIGFWRA
jgi:hypothetical protein